MRQGKIIQCKEQKIIQFSLLSIFFLFFSGGLYAQQLAFPGAEGYGKFTKGGRGGAVYEVTNLSDDGTGSLRAAVEASGPRTVVFRVSGTIVLKSELSISNPYITIAGQTAPGDGICLKDYRLKIDANHVIIRYIRIRMGDELKNDDDAVFSRYCNNIILDHLTASWSTDETMSVYNGDSTTVQWCLVSESLFFALPEKDNHGFGGIWGGKYFTYHHNLLAHHSSRNPRFSSGCGHTDYVNNVVYNWGYGGTYGAEKKDVKDPVKFSFAEINMRNNYYKPGPATTFNNFARPSTRDGVNDLGKWYLEGNYFYGKESLTNDNWLGVAPDDGLSYKLVQPEEPFDLSPIEMQTAEEAYNSTLENVGAILPKRDAIDTRIVAETKGQYATYEGPKYKTIKSVPDNNKICGMIDSQTDVGGWPELKSLPAPTDTDHDGMPDDWEDANSLNKNDPSDGNTIASNAYTMLEIYLNSIEFNYAVTGIQFSNAGDNNLSIGWSDTYLAEDGFIIEKSTDGINFSYLDSLAKNITDYIDSSQSVNPNLSYRIIAYQDSIVTPYPSTDYIENTSIEIITPKVIFIGDIVQMMVELKPENSYNRAIKWNVRDEDLAKASINNSGQLVALDSGMIQVSVQTLDGLEISNTISLHINEYITGFQKNHAFAESFDLFPNPFGNRITIRYNERLTSDASLSIYSVAGIVMMQNFPNSKQFDIDTESLPKGMYIISIQNNDKISNCLMVKN